MTDIIKIITTCCVYITVWSLPALMAYYFNNAWLLGWWVVSASIKIKTKQQKVSNAIND